MDRWSTINGLRTPRVDERVAVPMIGQDSFVRPRVSTIYPGTVNGADDVFRCEAAHGGTYYCKDDKPGKNVRAREWIGTHLAKHAGVVIPEFAILDDQQA